MKTTRLSQFLFSAVAVASITFSVAVSAQAQTESLALSFSGTSGERSYGNLIFDNTGHLYGTTQYGGNLSACQGQGCGVVFKATRTTGTAWKETVIHTFSGGRDGSGPQAGLVQDAAGNLYGTTQYGGSPCSYNSEITCGVVFMLSPGTGGGWKETVLHVFTGGVDGGGPNGGNLILDAAGNVYGTTHAGGDASGCVGSGQTGCGVVFELSKGSRGGWYETVLYAFNGVTDGAYPAGALVFDTAGNLYGAASYLGPGGLGSLFELSPTASGPWTFTMLHSFAGVPDGSNPQGSLVFDAAGNLYGMTYSGGTGSGGIGAGTAFELSPGSSGWTETILYNFTGQSDGGEPADGLIFDASGNLYGTTSFSEPIHHNYGVAFRLSPSSGGGWTEKVLHGFANGTSDGQYPYASLVFDKSGNLYGTTSFGGSADEGGIFKIVP
jgi:uncharacterized repeat protein (TIGR03803 family)